MANTVNNDINILQASDPAYVGAGAGDDVYIVSPVTMSAGQKITLTDTLGSNTLQLTSGLTIDSCIVASSALQLTLSNGAIITVLDADSFVFNVSGNAVTGAAGVNKDFATFASENLGITIPATGTAAGGASTVNDDGTSSINPTDPDYVVQTLEAIGGTPAAAIDFEAATQAFNFTDDASVQNNVAIANFTDNDLLSLNQAFDYAISNDGADVNISVNNDGIVSLVTLIGVVSANDLVSDEASLITALGFDPFA